MYAQHSASIDGVGKDHYDMLGTSASIGGTKSSRVNVSAVGRWLASANVLPLMHEASLAKTVNMGPKDGSPCAEP